jgi:dTDP-4-dehydrorhamnose 3,5-epimerase
MFQFKSSSIIGCYEIQPMIFNDDRGRFVKVFHREMFAKLGLCIDFVEEYYSHSRRDVIRGLHFQLPPVDHVKMVYCICGKVFDVVLDLRIGSPTYGKTAIFSLSAEQANYLYIPEGIAHGFCVISDFATMVYKVSSTYSPEHDAGVLWNSVEINWPTKSPILSERDMSFIPFSEFKSTFVYAPLSTL